MIGSISGRQVTAEWIRRDPVPCIWSAAEQKLLQCGHVVFHGGEAEGRAALLVLHVAPSTPVQQHGDGLAVVVSLVLVDRPDTIPKQSIADCGRAKSAIRFKHNARCLRVLRILHWMYVIGPFPFLKIFSWETVPRRC